MEDRDWLILQALYKYQNITRTAQSLFISQPALTNRLRQIEKEFGVTIVHRGRRGVHFTPEGEYLVKSAEEILAKMRQIKENVLNMDDRVVGTLRLGVSNFITRYHLPALLQQFKSQYPEVEFKVHSGWSKEIFQLAYNQEVHVGFVRGDYKWPDRKHLLFKETVSITSRNKFRLEDLPDLPRIDYQTDANLKTLIDNWWSENYTKLPLIGMEVDKVDTCKEMVASGLGYAILPSLILDQGNDLYREVIRDQEQKPVVRKSWMFYHEETLDLNVVRAFVRFIEGIHFPDYF